MKERRVAESRSVEPRTLITFNFVINTIRVALKQNTSWAMYWVSRIAEYCGQYNIIISVCFISKYKVFIVSSIIQ